eukprot:1132853_1
MSVDAVKQESVPGPGVHINKWNADDVYGYLSTINDGALVELAKLFKAEEVRGRVLFTITDDDLLKMGVSLGNRMEFRDVREELVKQFAEGEKQEEEEEMEHRIAIAQTQGFTTKTSSGMHDDVKENEAEDMEGGAITRGSVAETDARNTGAKTEGTLTEMTPMDAV